MRFSCLFGVGGKTALLGNPLGAEKYCGWADIARRQENGGNSAVFLPHAKAFGLLEAGTVLESQDYFFAAE